MNNKIVESIDLPDGKIVVFDWSSNKEYRHENLVCFNSDGSVRWRPELPRNGGPDCFVGVTIDKGQIRANTWSCFALWLDPLTGKTLKSVFTK
jgi:hypothetical protein